MLKNKSKINKYKIFIIKLTNLYYFKYTIYNIIKLFNKKKYFKYNKITFKIIIFLITTY